MRSAKPYSRSAACLLEPLHMPDDRHRRSPAAPRRSCRAAAGCELLHTRRASRVVATQLQPDSRIPHIGQRRSSGGRASGVGGLGDVLEGEAGGD